LLTRSVGLAAGAVLLLPGCEKEKEEKGEGEVSATEDLMREHGVLRRLLIVYREGANLLRTAPTTFDAGALGEASDLFRTFGEDYHEKQLEEQHVFPAVKALGGGAAGLIDALLAQHARGREINAYIKAKSASGTIGAAGVEPLAMALESFARMYEAHAAYEDTIVFQAWKASLSESQLHETGEKFEEIEHKQFSGDGFDQAVDQVARIEERLRLHDLGRYTASPAPA
jgi:hemerythrin-like domain-containing protein